MAELTDVAVRKLEGVAQNDTLGSVIGALPGQITRGLEGSRTSVVDSGETSSFLSNIGDAGKTLLKGGVDFTGSLATGTAKLSQITDTAAKAMGDLWGPLGAISAVGSDMLKFAEGSVDTLEGLSSSGASFNNSILQMNYAASQSRLTLDEFAGLVSKNSEQLVALGGSVTQGAKTFSNMSKAFFDDGLGDDLINMGFTFEEVNESLMNYAETNRRSLASGAITQEQARSSAASMAKEMDLIAKLTGKNRKEMEAEIQDRMRKGQVQAKLRLLEMSGNTKAAENFRLALAEAQKAGPDAVAALEETFTKGTVVSEAGRRGLVALGDAGNELTNVVNQINAGGAGVGPALDSFNAAVVERVNSVDFLNMASLGGLGGVADAAATVLENAGPYADAVRTSTQGAVDENASRQQILDAVQDMELAALAEQDARDGITHTLQMADARMKDTYAAIGQEMYGPNGIATQISNSPMMQDVAKGLENTTREEIQRLVSDLRSLVPGANAASSFESTVTMRQPGDVTVTQEEMDQIREVGAAVTDGIEQGSIYGANATANILEDLLSGPNASKALELLEASDDNLTAAESAIKAIEENNVNLARVIRDEISRLTTEQRAADEGIEPDNVDNVQALLNTLRENQATDDAHRAAEFVTDNMTVTSATMPTTDEVVQTVRDVTQQNEQSRAELGDSMSQVTTSLGEIPPALDGVKTETTSALNEMTNSLSTTMQNLINKMDEFIQGQNNQTRAISRNNPHIQ